MSLTSLGDLAQSLMLRQRNVQMRQEVNRLTQEMTTGQAADLARHLAGDVSYLSDIEHRLGLLKGYRTSVSEAAVFTSAMQAVLETIQTSSERVSQTILATSSSGALGISASSAQTAAQTFSQIVSALNTQTAGRSIFAGNATDQPAVVPPELILSELRAAITGQVSATTIRASVDAWFDDPVGGFETQVYTGSHSGRAPYRLDRQESIDLDIRANSPALKEVLKHTVLAALATDTSLTLQDSERADLLHQAGVQLQVAQDSLTTLRADLGLAQARIEEGRVRLSSEKTSLELARNTLLAVDPYDTATQLQNAQSQLESLYAVTVRISRLSLAEFMR